MKKPKMNYKAMGFRLLQAGGFTLFALGWILQNETVLSVFLVYMLALFVFSTYWMVKNWKKELVDPFRKTFIAGCSSFYLSLGLPLFYWYLVFKGAVPGISLP